VSDLFSYDQSNTPIDPDEEAQLIPSLSTRAELNAFELTNILEARTWAMSPRRLRSINPADELFLRELHRRMFNKVWRWAGQYRTTMKTIGVEVHRVQSDIGALIADLRFWIENRTFPPIELAARLHHRLVVIHPFCNGNGRHSRLFADIVAQKYWNVQLGWGAGTGDHKSIRDRYIEALRSADQNNFGPIIDFAGSGQIGN